MPRFCFLKLARCVLAASWTMSALAQDVADKPDLRVGDEWVFVQTGTEDGKPVNRRWQRRIVEMLPDDRIRVTPTYGGVDVFDRSWNPRHPQRPTFWPLDFQFPLSVGAKWSFASPFGASTTKVENFDQRGQHKVVALESISVPAGTFKCFRIEGESHWLSGYAYSSDYHYVERWRITKWYCPDVKYIAKVHVDRHISGSGVKATQSDLDSELLVFKPGKRIAPIPAPTDQASVGEQSPFEGRWEGEEGIWRIKIRVSGRSIEGTIQCQSKNEWSKRSPLFSGTVEENGTVDADTTEELKGWAPRQIKRQITKPSRRRLRSPRLSERRGRAEKN